MDSGSNTSAIICYEDIATPLKKRNAIKIGDRDIIRFILNIDLNSCFFNSAKIKVTMANMRIVGVEIKRRK